MRVDIARVKAGDLSIVSHPAIRLRSTSMPMIDVCAISLFRDDTAAFVHELAAEAISNLAGESNYVRVGVLTPSGTLDRDKQLSVVKELTEIVATAAGDPTQAQRTWVLLTESPDGGSGIAGHANTSADIVNAARAQLAAGSGEAAPSGRALSIRWPWQRLIVALVKSRGQPRAPTDSAFRTPDNSATI
jgi:phenylpyruvate tautomerase PptA (4-oxalocrotonate tautomerase family)